MNALLNALCASCIDRVPVLEIALRGSPPNFDGALEKFVYSLSWEEPEEPDEGGMEGEGEEEADDGLEDEWDDDEEDDTAERINASEDAPEKPPSGYKYMHQCPPLVSLADKKALVRCKVLTARIDEPCGWFIGTVASDIVNKTDKKKTPTATHMIEYKQKETGTRTLVGREAQTLTVEMYGQSQWWILLELES